YLCWTDAVWLTVAGVFWPIILSCVSIAILVKLIFSPFEDRTSAASAWLTLLVTWFYVPMWVAAIQLPRTAAVTNRYGHVYLASGATRHPDYEVWFLTPSSGSRIVNNVAGTIVTNSLLLEYTYAEHYIATRRHQDDL